MAETKNIKYLNRDFESFRNSLIEYSKTYFPTTYTDFSPSSPGMMFIEMASYVGDVLSFYLDNQTQENFVQYARQNPNLYSLAYMMGYRPKVTEASTVEVEIFQQVPAILSGGENRPDYNFALLVNENTQIKSSTSEGTNFIIEDSIDFTFSSSLDPTEVSVYQISGNQPEYFLLKKKRKAISSTINTQTFTIGDVEQFLTLNINANNIIKILDITDSDGNIYYEVPYLAQDTIFEPVKNTSTFAKDPNASPDSNEVPYMLNLKKVPRRFVSRFKNSTTLELQFGAGGLNNIDDENIVPNPNNVGIGLPFSQDKLSTAYSPTNFTLTNSYGTPPSNTTLTVRYLTGGGVSSNAPSNSINRFITTNNIKFTNSNLDPVTAQYIFNSVAINNPEAASGGKDGDTIEEIRLNSLNNFQTQLRSVTQEDYLIRALSLPSEYGSVSKIYAEQEKIEDLLPGEIPSVLSLYVLAFDNNKKLKLASNSLKQNLSTYLSQYRMINDSIKIKYAFIINIGIDFELIILPNYNSNEVITTCINALKDYFNIDKWKINQPIILRDLYILLDKVTGVQTVKNIEIINKAGENLNYSKYAYDIKGATQNNTIFPASDPSIFEIKFPDVDIRGKVISF